MWEMLPILLSIGLFIITLIVIFTLRSADRRDRRLDIMRRYVAQYMTEVKHSETQMRETVAEIDGQLARSRHEMEALIKQVTEQREGLLSHSEDLDALQKTLTYYHQVLGQLSAMTEKAELRTRNVKENISKVERVQDTIDEFLTDIAESEARMQQITESLERAVGHQDVRMKKQIEESVAEAKIAINGLLDDAMNQTDVTFQTMITTVQAFLRELNNRTEILEGVVRRLTTSSSSTLEEIELSVVKAKKKIEEHDQELASIAQEREAAEEVIEQLVQRKEAVEGGLGESSELLSHKEQELKELEQQVQTVQDELDLALAERQRLAEEEEQYELEMKARLDNPDVYDAEVDSEDIVPIFVAPEEESLDNEQLKLQEDEHELMQTAQQRNPSINDFADTVPFLEVSSEEALDDESYELEKNIHEFVQKAQLNNPDMYESEDVDSIVESYEDDDPREKPKKVKHELYGLEEGEEEIILDDDSEFV